MELYLLRHGQTTHPGTYTGVTEKPLSEHGCRQILELAPALRRLRFDRCFCSPLGRCRKTFELLAITEECQYEPGLKEIDFGNWEGRRFSELQELDPENVQRWVAEGERFTFPGGENIGRFVQRVSGWFDSIRQHDYQRVLVVSHGGVIRHGICHLLGLDSVQADRFEIQEGAVSLVLVASGYAVLKQLNGRG